MYISVVLRTLTSLYNQHHHPSTECFTSKIKLCCNYILIPHSPSSPPLASTSVPLIFMNLPPLRTSGEWNHTILMYVYNIVMGFFSFFFTSCGKIYTAYNWPLNRFQVYRWVVSNAFIYSAAITTVPLHILSSWNLRLRWTAAPLPLHSPWWPPPCFLSLSISLLCNLIKTENTISFW